MMHLQWREQDASNKSMESIATNERKELAKWQGSGKT
jgi:hypothetical protein